VNRLGPAIRKIDAGSAAEVAAGLGAAENRGKIAAHAPFGWRRRPIWVWRKLDVAASLLPPIGNVPPTAFDDTPPRQ